MDLELFNEDFPELLKSKQEEIDTTVSNLGDKYGLDKVYQHTFIKLYSILHYIHTQKQEGNLQQLKYLCFLHL